LGIHLSVAGKGGTGKTTFTALAVRCLEDQGKVPILAVDADANANLNEALGLEVDLTISEILAETKAAKDVPVGMTKDAYIELRLNESLAEGRHVDLLVMGGPEGPGCYCFPNEILKRHVERLSENYPYMIMDNEAGLEHLSRRVARDVDVLFVTSDPTVRGIRSAGRVKGLIKSLKLNIGKVLLVVTKVRQGDLEVLAPEIEKTGLELAGTVPLDGEVARRDLEGEPLVDVDGDSPALQAVCEILKSAGI